MRITAICALAAGIGVAALGVGMTSMIRMNGETAGLIGRTQAVQQLARDAARLAELSHHLVASEDGRFDPRIETRLDALLEALRNRALSEADRSLRVQITTITRLIRSELRAVSVARDRGVRVMPEERATPCLECRLLTLIGDLGDAVQRMGSPIFSSVERDAARLRRAGAAVGFGVGGMLCLLMIYIQLSVVRPLARLRGALAAAANGELDRRVPDSDVYEIDEIADAFNGMAENLSRLTATHAELSAEIETRKALEADLLARQAHLAEVNAELDQFAYIASHDLRGPLRAIGNIAEWIAEDLGSSAPAEIAHMLGLMKSRVRRLEALFDSLLQYNRLGRRPSPPEPVALDALTAEIAAQIGAPAGFGVVYAGAPLTLTTDRPALAVVLRHLIENALKHHDRETGAVVVSAIADGAVARIRVEDDGPGVPPALHERIFDLFQTLKPRDEVEGSGMGLAIARKAARLQGSTVTVESPLENGRGCAFLVAWPGLSTAASAAESGG